MILPSKTVKPIDSLYYISAYVVDILKEEEVEFNDLLDLVNQSYPKPVTIEKLQQCLDFLFIIGKLELKNETFKAVFR
ncbi:ABC-three component system middle component 6 [Vibrio cholerae]|uniref:ABC-three component system middle component 6 n=1 Tax=Vibrio cholerae TaxID=666 RepID=UPI003D34B73E